MNKIPYEEINNQQLVDVRTQYGYQAGHIKNSLNLNPGNFKKYATYYLDLNQPVIFVVRSEEEGHLEELSESANELGFNQKNGFYADYIKQYQRKEQERINMQKDQQKKFQEEMLAQTMASCEVHYKDSHAEVLTPQMRDERFGNWQR